ncbi:DinB family protein [Rhodococcus sp. G-MC3]|uniref:DinB family protein n=1 Tax=Rhodococcus sp. G-MC3 TaxID=3046209 RepID=UPI0024BB83EB|nr:DinB family protein [Rhodococcus sp. G-MC3]MDJ0394812.1 DinB family protein [Rhodococcus sp. G-MC3]
MNELDIMLDENRSALVRSVARLTDEQSRRRLVPSLTTPIALVKHCAAAERVWFQRTVAGIAESECDGYAVGDDAGWAVGATESRRSVTEEFEAAAHRSREICAGRVLSTDYVHYRRGRVTLFWIKLHMIEELARHAGHADILVEQILASETRVGA